jgi:hypothetical protein
MNDITKKLRLISTSRNIQKITYGKPRGKKASIFINQDEQ